MDKPTYRIVGGVDHNDGTHKATCSKKDCPWTYETTIDGEAAHKLMEHVGEEHAS